MLTSGQHGCCHGDSPFTMTPVQGAHGQVAVWCKYWSSDSNFMSKVRGPGVEATSAVFCVSGVAAEGLG